MSEIAKYVALGGTWLLVSYIGYIVKSNTSKIKDTKLTVMSCRKQIKQFKRLDEADSNSIW